MAGIGRVKGVVGVTEDAGALSAEETIVEATSRAVAGAGRVGRAKGETGDAGRAGLD